MDPKITSQIWSNQCFDEADVEGKLAALWLITNEQVDLLGYCNLNKRRFVFETRLTIEALAKGFAAVGQGVLAAQLHRGAIRARSFTLKKQLREGTLPDAQ
jgi:hypothetical protein